jgi:glycosyltransferase involved in cell wall biosynthesis
MSEILKKRTCHLLIVGEFWEGKAEYLQQISELNLESHLTVVDQYVNDEEVGNYFEQSDLVVLPYISATQSGIAQIAFSFNKTVVTTRVGGLIDLESQNDRCIMIEAGNSKAIVDAVDLFFSRKTAQQDIPDIKSQTWSDYVDLILQE